MTRHQMAALAATGAWLTIGSGTASAQQTIEEVGTDTVVRWRGTAEYPNLRR